MKLKQLFGFGLGLLLFISTLRSEPANVLVGDLTFVRPATWKFEPPTPDSPALSRFVIPVAQGRPGGVGFYLNDMGPESAVKFWKEYFPDKDSTSPPLEKKTIGQRTITYAVFHGTLKAPHNVPKKDHTFVGVVIPSGDKFVHVRLAGPAAVVQGALPDFKSMIERAIKEADDEK